MPDDRTRKRQWPYFPGQAGLLLPAIGMLLGSALPWAYILGRLLSASPSALMWTAWAGLATLAAAIAPWRAVAAFSALAGGATAVGFAVWQTGRIADRCGLSLDCLPGPGVGLLLIAGLAAVYRAVRMLRASAG